MTDKEFDRYLAELTDAPPAAELTEEFTPWRAAMNRILWGTVWTTLTLQFWYLDVLLPAVGWIMLLLGYRTLRNENRWFRLGYVLSWLRLVWWLGSFTIRATIYAGEPIVQDLLTAASFGMLVPAFGILLALRNGIRAVQQKAGLPPHGGNGLLVCFFLMLLFGSAQLGSIAVWGLLIAYVCILRSLFTLSKELDEAGYAVTPAPVRISDTALKRAYTGYLLLALLLGFWLFDSYRMDWQPVRTSEDPETVQIRQELLELGFPEEVLDDLTEADLLSCRGAEGVTVQVDDHPINRGRQVQETYGTMTSTTTIYDEKELRITGIAVELPDNQWKIIHHFRWVIDPGFRGTEVIQLWPAYQKAEGWGSSSALSGQVLYTKDGVEYSAPFHSLEEESYTQDTIFWGAQTSSDVFAEFSMPNRGENHRGYVCYTMTQLQEGWSINSWMNYIHQTPWPRYPVITAKQKQLTQGVGSNLTFKTIQDALQFFPDDDQP